MSQKPPEPPGMKRINEPVDIKTEHMLLQAGFTDQGLAVGFNSALIAKCREEYTAEKYEGFCRAINVVINAFQKELNGVIQ